MDGLFPTIFHGERSELREKYGLDYDGSFIQLLQIPMLWFGQAFISIERHYTLESAWIVVSANYMVGIKEEAHHVRAHDTKCGHRPLPQEVLGVLSEDDYRRYPSLDFKEGAIQKLRERFGSSCQELTERKEMLAGFARLCDVVATSDYPLQAAFDFIVTFSPLAKAHSEHPTPKTLWTHLQEVSEFAKEFIVAHGSCSRFPNLLTDREALLIAHVAAPLHDLMKYLGAPQAQILPDHEIMAAELVRRHFEGKRIKLPHGDEITFTRKDCVFLSELIGDHENIEKETGRTGFISSERSSERAKAIFFVLDTLTGVIKPDNSHVSWHCDSRQLDERFTDLVYRHIDLLKGKIFRPAWALITIKDLSHVIEHLSQQGMHVSGTKPGETFQQALARSGLRAIAQTLDDDKDRRELPPPQRYFTHQQLIAIEAARVELERLEKAPST